MPRDEVHIEVLEWDEDNERVLRGTTITQEEVEEVVLDDPEVYVQRMQNAALRRYGFLGRTARGLALVVILEDRGYGVGYARHVRHPFPTERARLFRPPRIKDQ